MKKMIVGLMLVVSVASVSMALNTPVLNYAVNHWDYCRDLGWTPAAGVDGYIVYRSTYPGGLEATGITTNAGGIFVGNPDRVPNVKIVSVTTDTISLAWDSVLTNGTSYYFKVQAYAGEIKSAVSNEIEVYVPARSILGYAVFREDKYGANFTVYATLPTNATTYTLTGLQRNSSHSYMVSGISAYKPDFDLAPISANPGNISPATAVSTTTLGCILSDPHSVSLSVQANVSSVTATVSVEGYDGYSGDGYYRFAHSVNPIITESDFANGVTGSVTSLVDNKWKINAGYTEGATNYYAVEIVDYNPDVTMVSDTKNCFMMSYQIDHFVVEVTSTVMAGASFPVTVTGKNAENVIVPFNCNSAVVQSVLASDELFVGSDILRVTAPATYEGGPTIFHFAYTKAEDIKIKVIYNGKVALSDTLSVISGVLSSMDVSVNPASIIAGQSSYITATMKDIYSSCVKNIKVQFQVNKGKGKLDKEEGQSDGTGKIKIKFYHDDVTPGINTIKVTALHLSQDIQINVAVLIYGKKGGTIVASEDPNTQVVIPPDAVSGDVQLMIKTGDELSTTIQDKVNTANDKAVDSMCEDKVRGFECKKDDGSDYGNFDDLVTIEIPYTDDDNDDIVDGTDIKVDDLKVCRLNEDTECWETVNDGGCNEIDKERKVIKAQVKHFSTYNIGAPSLSDLSVLQVYPNPINFSKSVRNTLKFGNLPQNTKIEIYDIIGRLVRSINSLDTNNVEWDGKNESGESISMGLYIYLLTDSNGNKKTGKIGVQK